MAELKPARRCTRCEINWPNLSEWYGHCPQCQRATNYYGTQHDVLTIEEGLSMLNRINFERYANGESLLPAPEPEDEQIREYQRRIEERERRDKAFSEVVEGLYAEGELEEFSGDI